MRNISPACFALIAVATAAPAAEVYRWVDDGGRVHYGNAVPDVHKRRATRVDVESSRVTQRERAAAEARLAREKSAVDAMRRTRELAQTKGASPPAARSAASSGKSTCAQEWEEFERSGACFAPYRLANGGIKAEAFNHCTSVLMPTCPNPYHPPTTR